MALLVSAPLWLQRRWFQRRLVSVNRIPYTSFVNERSVMRDIAGTITSPPGEFLQVRG